MRKTANGIIVRLFASLNEAATRQNPPIRSILDNSSTRAMPGMRQLEELCYEQSTAKAICRGCARHILIR